MLPVEKSSSSTRHFKRPPLNEVVLGVQFAVPSGFHQIRAWEVWELFKTRFRVVQELPALEPGFETFGPPQGIRFGFSLVAGQPQTRYWFLTDSGDELIQFQADRLLHNWRKVGDQRNEYPRFERMIEDYASELRTTDTYFRKSDPKGLQINQCEISYINHIYLDQDGLKTPQDWITFLTINEPTPEDYAASFRRILRAPDGRPVGRLTCEASSGYNNQGRPLIILQLTVRGAPGGSSVDAALDFLKNGRDKINFLFDEVTTESAQIRWERVSQ